MMNKFRTFPIFLILIGLISLFDNLNWINNAWGKLWPLILIVIGISSILKSFEFSCYKRIQKEE